MQQDAAPLYLVTQSLCLYQEDDPSFVQNVEGFLAAVVDARDALYPNALPAAPPSAMQPPSKSPRDKVNLPAFMYAFVLHNASVQFAGQVLLPLPLIRAPLHQRRHRLHLHLATCPHSAAASLP
jgi:hypothetical protein